MKARFRAMRIFVRILAAFFWIMIFAAILANEPNPIIWALGSIVYGGIASFIFLEILMKLTERFDKLVSNFIGKVHR